MRSEEFLVEGPDMREIQGRTWQALPDLMNRAGVKFTPSKELTRGDTFPRLGLVAIEHPDVRGAVFTVTASNFNGAGTEAEISFNVDVGTSNALHSGAASGATANGIAEFAKQLAAQLDGYVMNNPYSTGKHKIPMVKATVKLPLAANSFPVSSGSRYDPRERFMSQPGERARQARVAGSAYSDSFGGDSSNYTR